MGVNTLYRIVPVVIRDNDSWGLLKKVTLFYNAQTYKYTQMHTEIDLLVLSYMK